MSVKVKVVFFISFLMDVLAKWADFFSPRSDWQNHLDFIILLIHIRFSTASPHFWSFILCHKSSTPSSNSNASLENTKSCDSE